MSYKKNLGYRDVPLSPETPHEDFFIYDNVSNLYAKCADNKHKIIKIRTIGIFIAKNGRFYIKEINEIHNQSISPAPMQVIQVSMVYMRYSVRPPSVPYPVQIIGQLQWNCHPVIFAQIIEPLKVSVAMLLQETLNNIAAKHFHKPSVNVNDLPQQENEM